MNRALVAVLMLTGCAQTPEPPTPVRPHTTVYQYTSGVCTCPKVESEELRKARKEAADWKRYAGRLEQLLPPDAAHDPHP